MLRTVLVATIVGVSHAFMGSTAAFKYGSKLDLKSVARARRGLGLTMTASEGSIGTRQKS